MRCIFCGNDHFRALPDPHPAQALRSDCTIEPFPLNKSQCMDCGLLVALPRQEFSYGEGYDLYVNIHGSEEFDIPRKRNIAASILSGLNTTPKTVLEVGCGNGAMLMLMKECVPSARLSGIEPSALSAAEGYRKNLDIVQGIAGEDAFPELDGKSDLVYSIQVIEHTPDPTRFIHALAELATGGGHIAIRCPDGGTPSSELLYSDHRYSFLPFHLHTMLQRTGLTVLSCGTCAAESGKEKSLMAMAVKGKTDAKQLAVKAPSSKEIEDLYDSRAAYMHAWADLEGFLLGKLKNAGQVACFGAAQWASLLGCYAPEAWNRISACFIDGAKGGKCMGKPVRDYSDIRGFAPQITIIGTNPASQPFIRDKLASDGFASLAWNDRIAV